MPYPILAAACGVLGGLAITSGGLRVNLLSQSLRSLGILYFLGFGSRGMCGLGRSLSRSARQRDFSCSRRQSGEGFPAILLDVNTYAALEGADVVGSALLIVAIVPVLDRASSSPSEAEPSPTSRWRIEFFCRKPSVGDDYRYSPGERLAFQLAVWLSVYQCGDYARNPNQHGLTAAGIVALMVLLPFVGELPITSTEQSFGPRFYVSACICGCAGHGLKARNSRALQWSPADAFDLLGGDDSHRELDWWPHTGTSRCGTRDSDSEVGHIHFCLIWLTARFRSTRRAARDSGGVTDIVTPA